MINSPKKFESLYSRFYNADVSGRYLSSQQLFPQLQKIGDLFRVKEIGSSPGGLPVQSVQIGSGKTKILAWSQMHGNETTTTKAILDLFMMLGKGKQDPEVREILDQCTLFVIPMLNPDGAARYTRENGGGIDLNRDAYNCNEPESRILRNSFDSIKPDFCFNLHDQRTIFSAGDRALPATISFLAPAMDEQRSLTKARQKAMQLIVAMNQALQLKIPGQVGRYDDAFNINCTGDRFMNLEAPTILFEAGHYAGDYSREQTRKLIALALWTGLRTIATRDFPENGEEQYLNIPENQQKFYDVIIRNVSENGRPIEVGIQFREELHQEKIIFTPVVVAKKKQLDRWGHREIDGKGAAAQSLTGKTVNENDIVAEILLNDNKVSIISQDNP